MNRSLLHFFEGSSAFNIGLVALSPNHDFEMNQYAQMALSGLEQEFFNYIQANKDALLRDHRFTKFDLKQHSFFIRAKQWDHHLLFCLLPLSDFPFIQDEMMKSTYLTEDLNAIFSSSWDVIFVADAKGTTLRVSSACEKLWGYPAQYFIGKSVYELEEEGLFKPSVTRLVLEQKRQVTQLQETKTGRRLYVTGTPVFNDAGELVRVINTSRDITGETRLKEELNFYREQVERYEKELIKLKREQRPFEMRSSVMEKVYDLSLRVAQVNSTVLITGETGVGKSFLARFIHSNSERAKGPFITVNCGSIPENLLESELFGYIEGAFTGAQKGGKPGMVDMAEGGTLFLDEIGELPLGLQVKLLQLVQDKTFIPVGGTKPKQADVRIIAATNRDLKEMVKNKTFREDLYYRLSVIPIHIPPLRERKEDIITLIYTFLNKYNQTYNKSKSISQEVFNYLMEYDWPGNIRELENMIERIIVTTEHDMVTMDDIILIAGQSEHKYTQYNTELLTLKEAVEKTEKEILLQALKKYGNTTEMAKALGVNQSTISRKLRKYKLSMQ
ncbi:PAS domain S-box-containing protein/TyrR family helix-turn-helix protein [Caldalkalibacillus uzonensis]|uniref:HTH-type transcriptional regulatory protein TyrR n=1 Tax=Caldalkalibacillus uzonensis TaxID=353224 RepID=A0ABU0CWR3_9BACI|nr:sigma 54-interacting transcriptional regulator [Caldalkalibacillus uzonensis]MDQ0340769.1 PAS domain S-box-containing protein/TyrR family helix-turn-helix protein [Caldalkalibacillus uzonensis]